MPRIRPREDKPSCAGAGLLADAMRHSANSSSITVGVRRSATSPPSSRPALEHLEGEQRVEVDPFDSFNAPHQRSSRRTRGSWTLWKRLEPCRTPTRKWPQ